MFFNTTCNSTLDNMRIGSEDAIAGNLTFHQLALLIGGVTTAFAILMSLYLMFRHATNYTKPEEQKHIIRILFMVPVYATSSFLCIWFYWRAVYYQIMSDCYEAFAISSFFALMCNFIAPDVHDQKVYFRSMRPIKPWVMPISWLAHCCGGQRGAWRTPKSGLTWFNIVWIGIYHYCFIRVTMTITAVISQYFDKYCESSDSPVFAHIWIEAIECVAVSIAMYCVIQFYIQLRYALAEHQPFLKVVAIKLVIFLSFWQSAAISVGTSTLNFGGNSILAYPDIKVGIPSLLLCVEMACFAVLHLWAFPYAPYRPGAKQTYYPSPDPSSGVPPRENEHGPARGGFLGIKAFIDAANCWDIVKAFGRGIRWLFCGVRRRHEDPSYHNKENLANMDTSYSMEQYGGVASGKNSTAGLPATDDYRRNQFGTTKPQPEPDETEGLIHNAQRFSNGSPPNPSSYTRESSPYRDPSEYHDPQLRRDDYYEGPSSYDGQGAPIGMAVPYQPPPQAYSGDGQDIADSSHMEYHGSTQYQSPQQHQSPTHYQSPQQYSQDSRPNPRNSVQRTVGTALWGNSNPQQGPPGQAF